MANTFTSGELGYLWSIWSDELFWNGRPAMGLHHDHWCRERRYKTPEWMQDRAEVICFLERQFNLNATLFARHLGYRRAKYNKFKRAAWWFFVINGYFRPAGFHRDRELGTDKYVGPAARDVALDWLEFQGIDDPDPREVRRIIGRINSTVQDIRASIDGERRDGKPRTGRQRGRPRTRKFEQVLESIAVQCI
jgi:hypothetical protein